MRKTRSKRVLECIALLIFTLFIVSCSGKQTGEVPDSDIPFDGNTKRYALNLYDGEHDYQRGLDVYYDVNGKLERLEVYFVYYNNSSAFANLTADSKGVYPDAVSNCIINEDASVKISNYITSASIDAGALADKNFYLANSIYDKVKTEEDAKAFFENQIQHVKESGVPPDEGNYIIINGQNAEW